VDERAAPDDLVSAIRVANQGNVFLYPTMAKLLVKDFLQRSEAGATPPGEELTAREREVMQLVAEGLSNASIARELVVTERAVEKHVTRILQKLRIPPNDDHHRRVLAAIGRRDAEGARKAMLDHIEAVEGLVIPPDAVTPPRRGRPLA